MMATANVHCQLIDPADVQPGDIIAIPDVHEHMIRVEKVTTGATGAPVVDYGHARRPLHQPVYRALRDRAGIPIHEAQVIAAR